MFFYLFIAGCVWFLLYGFYGGPKRAEHYYGKLEVISLCWLPILLLSLGYLLLVLAVGMWVSLRK